MPNEDPPDRRLPMRGDPLRGQRGSAARLHLPLHGMSASDRQRVLNGAGCAGAAFHTRGPSRARSNAKPTAGARSLGGSAPICGTWIWSGSKPDPATSDAVRVRAGTLDDTSWLRPTAHFGTRSARPWVVLPEEDQRFETQPEDLAWMRAVTGSIQADAAGAALTPPASRPCGGRRHSVPAVPLDSALLTP